MCLLTVGYTAATALGRSYNLLLLCSGEHSCRSPQTSSTEGRVTCSGPLDFTGFSSGHPTSPMFRQQAHDTSVGLDSRTNVLKLLPVIQGPAIQLWPTLLCQPGLAIGHSSLATAIWMIVLPALRCCPPGSCGLHL